MSQETCEICGERIAQKEKYICTITGSEWYMCKECEEFFLLMDKENRQYNERMSELGFDEFDFEME